MRISKRDLEATVDRLNIAAGTPCTPYTKVADGKFRANPGNYHLDWAYGGVKFVRMENEGGGISNPTHMGFESKKVCYDMLHSFIAGLNTAKGEA